MRAIAEWLRQLGSRLPKVKRTLIVLGALGAVAFGGAAWYRNLPENRFQAALQAMPAEDYSVVEAALESLRDLPDYQPHAHLLRGFLLLRSQQFEEATLDFSFAFEHPDTRVTARVLAGECYYRQQVYHKAAQVLKDAIVIDRDNVAAYHWLASVMFDEGAYNYARSCLLKIVQLTPDDGKPHWFLAQLSSLHAEYSESAKELRKALQCKLTEKQRGDVYLDLAMVQVETRQYADALKSLSHCPRSAAALTLEAECHFSEGDKAKAQAALDRALQLSPDNLGALTLQGKIYLQMGNAQGAVKVLTKAEAANYGDGLIHHQLAAAYRQLGNVKAAEVQTKRSVEVEELRTRYTALERQAATQPDDAELRYELGTISQRCRDPEEAKRWFNAALGIDPSFKKARAALKRLSAAEKPPASSGRRLARE